MTGSVWILFLLARGFTMLEIGIAEGFFHVVSLLFEVPSGAVADLLGRKRVMLAGRFCMVLSALLMIASGSVFVLCIAMAFCALSYNLNSGTEDALVYDSLKEAGDEEHFLKINANKGLLYRISEALSNACSFISISIGFVGSYLANVVVALTSAFVISKLKEPEHTESRPRPKPRDFVHSFADHMQISMRFLIKNPTLAVRMFLDCSLGAMYTLTLFFMQQHFVSSGLPPKFVGIPLILIGIGQFAGNRAVHLIAGRMSYGRLAVLSLSMGGIGSLLSAARLIPLSIFGSIVLGFFAAVLELSTSARVNAQIPSAQRATLISVGSMLFSIVMVIASPLTGFLCDTFSTSIAFSILGSYLILLCVIGSVSTRFRLFTSKQK